jgi:quinohemoprotein ethanol dehydrogenase
MRSALVVALATLAFPIVVTVQSPDSNDLRRPAGKEWSLTGGDWGGTRSSALSQITRQNVAQLAGAWMAELPGRESQNKATPVVKDGLLYLPTNASVKAFDARTGALIWSQPTTTSSNRGVALGEGLVFVGQFDGSVIALDAKTGKPAWKYAERVEAGQRVTGAPAYANGIVIIGVSGGDWFARCRVVALEAKTGKELWNFYTVPSPGEPGSETWPKDNDVWKYGGAAVWTLPAVDVDLGMVYVETGNAVPPWGGDVRAGDNLYTCAVVALDLKTGQLRWYRQLLHHDVWESDVSTPLVLYDSMLNGQRRQLLAAMRTDGMLFLIDRKTGVFVQTVEERAVKQNSQLKTAKTQPHPVGAQRLGPDCVPRDTVPEGFQLGCYYDPILPDVPNLVVPYMNARFSPMSYSAETSYLYVTGCVYPFWVRRPDYPYVGFGPVVSHIPGQKYSGSIAALDGRTAKIAWEKRLPYPACGGSGTMVTATGLVFHGEADGNLQAYDAKSGELVWQFQTGSLGPWSPALGPGTGPAITYELDGAQYVAFAIDRAVWAFKLGGPLRPRAPLQPPPAEEPFRGAVREIDEISIGGLLSETNAQIGREFEWFSEHVLNPTRAQVKTGTTVKWVNTGKITHTITARDSSWTTGPIAAGKSGSMVFTKPGTYAYICADHPWSIGQLIVVP